MVGGFAARMCGLPTADTYRVPARSFRAQMRVREMFGHDGLPAYGYGAFGAWELGGEIRWPDDAAGCGGDESKGSGVQGQAPQIVRHPVESEDDVGRISLPGDIRSAGAVPLMLEFSRLQQRQGLPVGVHLGSAFTRAANLAGPARFLRWCLSRPDLAHRLVRISTDLLAAMAELWAESFPGRELGATVNVPMESGELVSPRIVEEFSLPYMIGLHERALALGFTSFSLHLCGDHTANLELWNRVPLAAPGGRGAVSADQKMDLRKVVETFGDRAVIKGNVAPDMLQMGDEEQILSSARRALEIGDEAPSGFVLAPGCEIPVDTPPYHAYLFVKAARMWGRGGR